METSDASQHYIDKINDADYTLEAVICGLHRTLTVNNTPTNRRHSVTLCYPDVCKIKEIIDAHYDDRYDSYLKDLTTRFTTWDNYRLDIYLRSGGIDILSFARRMSSLH